MIDTFTIVTILDASNVAAACGAGTAAVTLVHVNGNGSHVTLPDTIGGIHHHW